MTQAYKTALSAVGAMAQDSLTIQDKDGNWFTSPDSINWTPVNKDSTVDIITIKTTTHEDYVKRKEAQAEYAKTLFGALVEIKHALMTCGDKWVAFEIADKALKDAPEAFR